MAMHASVLSLNDHAVYLLLRADRIIRDRSDVLFWPCWKSHHANDMTNKCSESSFLVLSGSPLYCPGYKTIPSCSLGLCYMCWRLQFAFAHDLDVHEVGVAGISVVSASVWSCRCYYCWCCDLKRSELNS